MAINGANYCAKLWLMILHWRNPYHDTTVVLHYNDHLYNGNFDFQRNFFGNGSLLIKIYCIITELALSDTDGDSRWLIAFFTHFFIH